MSLPPPHTPSNFLPPIFCQNLSCILSSLISLSSQSQCASLSSLSIFFQNSSHCPLCSLFLFFNLLSIFIYHPSQFSLSLSYLLTIFFSHPLLSMTTSEFPPSFIFSFPYLSLIFFSYPHLLSNTTSKILLSLSLYYLNLLLSLLSKNSLKMILTTSLMPFIFEFPLSLYSLNVLLFILSKFFLPCLLLSTIVSKSSVFMTLSISMKISLSFIFLLSLFTQIQIPLRLSFFNIFTSISLSSCLLHLFMSLYPLLSLSHTLPLPYLISLLLFRLLQCTPIFDLKYPLFLYIFKF